jgi:hypothetical protein
VPVRHAGLAGFQRHLHDRPLRILTVQLLLDVLDRDDFHRLTLLMAVSKRHATGAKHGPDRKQP